MPENIEGLSVRQFEEMICVSPLDDLRPAAATRIEAVCLAQMRRRNPPAEWQVTFWRALEVTLASLLSGSYLLWNLGQALAIYGIHLP